MKSWPPTCPRDKLVPILELFTRSPPPPRLASTHCNSTWHSSYTPPTLLLRAYRLLFQFMITFKSDRHSGGIAAHAVVPLPFLLRFTIRSTIPKTACRRSLNTFRSGKALSVVPHVSLFHRPSPREACLYVITSRRNSRPIHFAIHFA